MQKSRTYMYGIIFIICSLFCFFLGAVVLFANYMHRQEIKGFETTGKVYTGTVTSNYFFYIRDLGNSTGIRTHYMICFKPSEPPEPIEIHETLCSDSYISRSLANQYPVGSSISAYFRYDIQDTLLIPGIENWRNSKLLQNLPYGFFGLGIVLFLLYRRQRGLVAVK